MKEKWNHKHKCLECSREWNCVQKLKEDKRYDCSRVVVSLCDDCVSKCP